MRRMPIPEKKIKSKIVDDKSSVYLDALDNYFDDNTIIAQFITQEGSEFSYISGGGGTFTIAPNTTITITKEVIGGTITYHFAGVLLQVTGPDTYGIKTYLTTQNSLLQSSRPFDVYIYKK